MGNTVQFGYDGAGNLASTTDTLGHVTHMIYDSKGRLVASTDAAGNTSTFANDANGNRTQITDPLGNTTTFTYDLVGNMTSRTNAKGQTTQFNYDGKNRLVQIQDVFGKVTSYSYDAVGNLTAITDVNGNTTTYDYDAFNRLVNTTNPLRQIKTLTYDGKGNLITSTDAKGQTVTFIYDALNRLIQKTTPDNTVTFSYDKVGNMLTATDNDSSLAFAYDKLNRMVQASTGATAAQPATTITYTYDTNGNRTSMTDPQGGITSYAYDALNRLTSLTNSQGQSFAFSYDVLSRRTALNFPNGNSMSYAYDTASRLLSLAHMHTGSPLASFSYSYDQIGNRTSLTELNRTRSYSYDGLNRIVQATHPTVPSAETFGYDPAGNRTSAVGITASFDAANRLSQDTDFTYAYDANGNLTSKTHKLTKAVTAYAHDAENQLIQVSAAGLTATYRYDALGRRIEKNVNGTITRYIYNNRDILLELDNTNQVIARYTQGSNIDEPLAMLRNNQNFFYHADGLGSVTELTDSAGNIVRSYVYDSFGQVAAETGNLANPFTYTAREIDPESGLYYYRQRYYSPATGRFLQEDLIKGQAGLPDTLNLYTYVFNNPLVFVDPLGLLVTCVGAGGSLAAGAYFGASASLSPKYCWDTKGNKALVFCGGVSGAGALGLGASGGVVGTRSAQASLCDYITPSSGTTVGGGYGYGISVSKYNDGKANDVTIGAGIGIEVSKSYGGCCIITGNTDCSKECDRPTRCLSIIGL